MGPEGRSLGPKNRSVIAAQGSGLRRRTEVFERYRAQRPAYRLADNPHVRLDPAVGIERAVGGFVGAAALGHGDRALDRFDDVGEADLVHRAAQGIAPAGAARADQQPVSGESLHQFLRGGEGDTGLVAELGRAEAHVAITARGGGHHHDRIIGKVGKAHV